MNEAMLMARLSALEDGINLVGSGVRHDDVRLTKSQWVPNRIDTDSEMSTIATRSLQRDTTYDEFRFYDFVAPTAVVITDWNDLQSGTGKYLLVARQASDPSGPDTPTVRYLDIHQLYVDEKVKVSSNDTTAGYLYDKLVAGTYITLTEQNDGGNETLRIDMNFPALDLYKVKVSANDTTPNYLYEKLYAGPYIKLTELHDGGDEDVQIEMEFPSIPLSNLISGVNGDIIYYNGTANEWLAATWLEYLQWFGVWTEATIGEVSIYAPTTGVGGAIHHVKVLGIDKGEI